MNDNQPTHPADVFGPFLDRYEALEAMILDDTEPEHIQMMLRSINECFRTQLDQIAGVQ